MRPLRTILAALSVTSALLAPTISLADDVLPGYDLYATVPPFQPPRPESYQDFTGPFTIPADFFDPGSDPFQGRVYLVGVQLGAHPDCVGDLGNADTIIRRNGTAHLPVIGSSDTVPIEIIALSLTSTSPITVTYNGGNNPELWRLDVVLSPSRPSTGSMTLDHSLSNGGAFEIQYTLYETFTFTRLSDISHRDLDEGVFSIGNNFTIAGTAVWWLHSETGDPVVQPSCTSNFVGSYDGTRIDTQLLAPYAGHGIYPAVPSTPTAAQSVSWGAIKLLYH